MNELIHSFISSSNTVIVSTILLFKQILTQNQQKERLPSQEVDVAGSEFIDANHLWNTRQTEARYRENLISIHSTHIFFNKSRFYSTNFLLVILILSLKMMHLNETFEHSTLEIICNKLYILIHEVSLTDDVINFTPLLMEFHCFSRSLIFFL